MSKETSFENALAFAQDLIRIPSLPGDEGALANRVLEEFEALGLEEIRRDDMGNVMGVARGAGSAPPVMMSCHLDMVAEGDHDEWEYPPFDGVVAEGYLHGRGAMDIKGPLALQTYAAAAMAGKTPGDVIVAHTVLEERGGWGMQAFVESGAVSPAAVIIGESTRGDIATGHRGRGEIEVVIRGLAGHASAPDRARNALDLLPPVLRAIQAVNAAEGSDPVLGKATAVASGVDVRPESRNVIPDEVVVVVDWRILPGDTRESLVGRLEPAVLREVGQIPEGFRVEVRGATEAQHTYTGQKTDRHLLTPGFLMDSAHPIIQAAARAAGKREGGGAATARPWAFATDGGWTCGVHGIPSFGFAPGEERHAHTNTERLDVEEARWAFGRYPEIVRAVQETLV